MEKEPDIIFEFYYIGNSVRVSAFHTPSLTEIFTITPSSITKEQMKKEAYKKLQYVLNKKDII